MERVSVLLPYKKDMRLPNILTSEEETPVEDEGAVGVSRGVDDNLTSLVFTVCISQHSRLFSSIGKLSKEKSLQFDKIQVGEDAKKRRARQARLVHVL